MKIYDFKVLNAAGESVSLEKYKKKVLLIINSATECGFTPQYEQLQNMYERFGGDDFIILDFPCNQFGNQAPGTNEEIADFCESRYGVTFPLFSKIDVNGENAEPLFQYLKAEKDFQGFNEEHPLTTVLENILKGIDSDYAAKPDIKWNFTKFLIDRNGNVIERYEPTADIGGIEERVKALLNS